MARIVQLADTRAEAIEIAKRVEHHETTAWFAIQICEITHVVVRHHGVVELPPDAPQRFMVLTDTP